MKERITKIYEVHYRVDSGDLNSKPEEFDDLDEALKTARQRILNSQQDWPTVQIRRELVMINAGA